MQAHNASASRVWLWTQCAYWAHASTELPREPPSASGTHGTEVHYLVHCRLSGRPAPESTARARHQAGLILGWLADNCPTVLSSEVAMVYDTARDTTEHRLIEGRAYGDISKTQVPGSADIMYLDAANQRAVVLDIKTGFLTGPVDASLQMETLAVAAATLYGVSQATVAHIRVDDEKAWGEWHELSLLDLDVHRNRLAELLAKSTGLAPGDPRPGPHCGWCPARTVCPKTLEMTAALPRLSIKTASDAARVYPQLKPIRDLLSAIEHSIEDLVDANGTIDVGPDHELRFIPAGGGETVSVKEIPDDLAATLRDLGVIKQRQQGRRLFLAKRRTVP